MIKLSPILKEIKVLHPSGDHDAYNKIVKYVRNGSKGNLDLSESNLVRIPSILKKVEGYLNLYNCISLTSLPDNLQVGVDLYLRKCINLTTLPSGLKIERDIKLNE